MPPLRVLYDGWPLVREPTGPAALHLLAWLAHLPDFIEAFVAFPKTQPEWTPPRVQSLVRPAKDTVWGRLLWEQRRLPGLLAQTGAHRLHVTSPYAPLFSGGKTIVSPAWFEEDYRQPKRLAERLRNALAQGGLARAGAILWPNDLPGPDQPGKRRALSPFVHPDYVPKEHFYPLDIGVPVPETYVLYHGPADARTLQRVLAAWTWPAGSMGGQYPLYMVGMSERSRPTINQFISEYQLENAVEIAPRLDPRLLPAIYQKAAAVFHPASVSPWGGPVRHGLACGKPLVGIEAPLIDAMVGPAAYLSDPNEARDLGAGLISVIVRDDVPKQLRQAARQRSEGWAASSDERGKRLAEIYAEDLGPR